MHPAVVPAWLALSFAASSIATAAEPLAATTRSITAARSSADARQAAAFAAIMREHAIAGAQLVHVRAGRHEEYDYGRRGDGHPVDAGTLFQAASLSKVIAAYVTLRLVDAGHLDLDTPLWHYWPSPRSRDDARARTITARMVLTHTTGLPNWQISPSDPALDRTPLVTQFAPGSRYQYSGEGFYLLQKTLEHLSALDWDTLVRREVFDRFDMPSSHYVTAADQAGRLARGHDRNGRTRPLRTFPHANTAWTLVTCAGDYSRFVQGALYRGEGLSPALHALMLAEASDADDRALPSPADPYVSWGLGVGRQTVNGHTRVWHWGDNPGFKAFFMLDPASGESLVLLTNSENGLDTYKDVLRLFFGPGDWPAVDWARRQS